MGGVRPGPRGSGPVPRGPGWDRWGFPGSPGTSLGSLGGPRVPWAPGGASGLPGPSKELPEEAKAPLKLPKAAPGAPLIPRASKYAVFIRQYNVYHKSQNRPQGSPETPPRLSRDSPMISHVQGLPEVSQGTPTGPQGPSMTSPVNASSPTR